MRNATMMRNQHVPMGDIKIIFQIVEHQKKMNIRDLLFMTPWEPDYFYEVIKSCKRRGYIEVNNGEVTQGYRVFNAAPNRELRKASSVLQADRTKSRGRTKAKIVDYESLNPQSKSPERLVVG